MENNIQIAKVLQTSAVLLPDEADKLFSFVNSYLEKGQMVTLNFENIEDVSSLFLNSFYGKLFRLYKSQAEHLISISGIDYEHDIFYDMIKRAEFLAKNPRHNVSSRRLAIA